MLDTTARVQSDVTPIQESWIEPLDMGRLERAKSAFSTRRVEWEHASTLLLGQRSPKAGDLVLARVTRLGQHGRLELANGRRARLHIGDEVVVCYGNRYAPDQFEAILPKDLERCHLVAAGGIASRMQCKHSSVKRPTSLEPVGLLGDELGRPLNIASWALPAQSAAIKRPPVIAVAGSSMNAGKTTTAAHLIKGLARAGLSVGAAKVTGTGAGGDVWFMHDYGAAAVYDFTDAGHATTYCTKVGDIKQIMLTLIGQLTAEKVDVIVMEIADGLYQEETSALLESDFFPEMIDGLVFAAADAMGAYAGRQWLEERGLPLLTISGAISASPLAAREAGLAMGVEICSVDQLTDPEIAVELLQRATTKELAELQ